MSTPGRDPDLDGSIAAVAAQHQALRHTPERLLERQLHCMLGVASLLRARRASAAGRRGAAREAAAAKERLEEVGEGAAAARGAEPAAGPAEQVAQLLLGDRSEPAAPAAGRRPAEPARTAAGERVPSRRPGPFVLLPVGAQFVVLLPRLGVAQHFVRLVDLLEALLGCRIVVVDVGVALPRLLPVCLLDRVPATRCDQRRACCSSP